MVSQGYQLEYSALKIGVILNLMIGIAGWIAFSLTGSEALLLDGNFSLISSVTTIAAILIIHKKHKRTSVFPYGRYFYESFFTFSKGILILGLIIAALIQNILKIIAFIEGDQLEKLKTGPILIYMALMIFLCFGLAFLYQHKNKKIHFQSSILNVETKASKIDGFMTIAVGIALVLTTFVPESSKLSFLLYIGDSIIVILMCLFLFQTPFEVIKGGFIELAGGSLQDKEAVHEIEMIVKNLLPNGLQMNNCHISKTGSSHLVLVYASSSTTTIATETVNQYRNSLHEKLEVKYPNSEVEIVFR
ncbi:MAG: cation transporter [Flavobacteriales bacterium]|nr:cation transporter [Flavobacteriales bacterium]